MGQNIKTILENELRFPEIEKPKRMSTCLDVSSSKLK